MFTVTIELNPVQVALLMKLFSEDFDESDDWSLSNQKRIVDGIFETMIENYCDSHIIPTKKEKP